MTIRREFLEITNIPTSERKREAYKKRKKAAEIARDRLYWSYDSNSESYEQKDPSIDPIKHKANGDENIPLKPMSFTKGLPHNFISGLLKNENDFDEFVNGINTGKPEDFKQTQLGPDSEGDWKSADGRAINAVRAWESAGAGLTYDLQGPDAQSVTMPPAPKLGSDELTAEIAEVYAQALLRDIPFSEYFLASSQNNSKVEDVIKNINSLPYFHQKCRNDNEITRENAFRGITAGDNVGPYLSQFLLAGNRGLGEEWKASYGKIQYGSITMDQRVRVASPVNYLTDWKSWFDVQNGAAFSGLEKYESNERRFITTPRDMATYVHYDALYEAYLNACILLLNMDKPKKAERYDKGVPFQKMDSEDHQQGFAHYGGPHILTLVTEVATRALKAVRYQKFNIHRRLRPEVLAARMHKLSSVTDELINRSTDSSLRREMQDKAKQAVVDFEKMYQDLNNSGILGMVAENNPEEEGNPNFLLPMAFAEGSPMHPSYGAGHATVAGACVTILKAFFNQKLFIEISENGDSCKLTDQKPVQSYAFVPDESGAFLRTYKTDALTLEGELNKLAANISIGRDWAGVHYYSDYVRSLHLGEEIAIGLLEEQALMYNKAEGFYLTLPKFDGTTVRIDHNGVQLE